MTLPTSPLAVLAAYHDVHLESMGTLDLGVVYACMGDCACWFVVSDRDYVYIDRYSFVSALPGRGARWCAGQAEQPDECRCHQFPPDVERLMYPQETTA